MNSLTEIYPWQADVWRLVNQDDKRRAHALLLHGRAGIGKYDFARCLSQALLCAHKDDLGHACGKCSSCNWFNEESHPDFRLLSPEQEADTDEESSASKKTKKKTQISVAQIRELSDFLSLSSHRSDGLRIILIHPAEALNLASANALLKMLEEPAEGVVFILVAHQLQRLLPTIISRCQKINMPMPSDMQALAWLNEQGVKNAKEQLAYLEGSPIKVFSEQLQFAQLTEIWRLLALGSKLQPHTAAPMLIASSVEIGVIALQKWIYDIVAIRFSQQLRYHVAHATALQALADKVNLASLFQLQKKVDNLRKLALHPLNHELQMESLLLEYTRIFQPN
ncbi:DNA polymerase III subunit delta' [Methylotenera sp.]|uniref:DNA polymerase III subunit delta' n=1 Tax=Methylotenera sp. TaxID=2051956 RepID=UPI002733D33A|nr:DNA polymerase III subunit delta' [Methylotenera sp.]MDP3307113.1 DNA polymerase III subunit delta' [Methylotenera sp.]